MSTFEQAIAAHEAWKTEFERAIRNGGDGLSVDAIRVDDHCLLGQWLRDDPENGMTNPTAVAMLREVHAEFHQVAAQVVWLAQSGRIKEAVRSMDASSQYRRWSATLVDALQRYVGTAGDEVPSR